MTTIKAIRTMPFNRTEIWNALADFPNVQNYSPSVKKSYALENTNTGLGAKRHCDLTPFGSIDEEIIEFKENELMGVKIFDSKKMPPFKDMVAHFQLQFESDTQTKVEFEISWGMKMGVIGKMMNAMMLKPQFQKGAENFLLGLEHYVKTGAKISEAEMKVAA